MTFAAATAADNPVARWIEAGIGRRAATAIRHDQNAELDYRALFGAVERVAAGLLEQGIRVGDVIGYAASHDAESVILLLAILRAGGVCLPLDRNYPAARLRDMLEDAAPRLLVTPQQDRAAWPVQAPWCARESLGSGAGSTELPSATAELAYVLFTSGSTGRPKGVAMRSAAFWRLIDWHVSHPRLGLPARTLQFAPLGFDVAFQEILSTFATGGCLVLLDERERRDPYVLLALLAREKVERLFVPYVALQTLAEAMAMGGDVPSFLRDVVTAGEQLRITPAIRAMFAVLPGCVLHNQYGPTETHVVSAHELSGDPSGWPDLPPIGRPLPHVRVRVVDEAMDRVDGGAEGELLLGGDCLAAGYIHRPDLTAERFVEHDGERWYRTGDRVRFNHDGVLEFLGRVDAQVKVGGYRIEPGEIESVLARDPAAAEVVVVASGRDGDRKLVAHVVSNDAHADEAELIARWKSHCSRQLAAYMVPQQFIVHAALPLTASGKIDRRALENDDAQMPLHWPEASPLEEQLRSLWQQLLGLPALDLQANVFDHGARSLTVIRALNELRKHGFRSVSAAQIYEHPGIAAMAAMLRGQSGAASADEAQARGHNQRAALARFAPRPGRAQ